MSSGTAPMESVWRELVDAFGEERATEILNDTTPPRRRRGFSADGRLGWTDGVRSKKGNGVTVRGKNWRRGRR